MSSSSSGQRRAAREEGFPSSPRLLERRRHQQEQQQQTQPEEEEEDDNENEDYTGADEFASNDEDSRMGVPGVSQIAPQQFVISGYFWLIMVANKVASSAVGSLTTASSCVSSTFTIICLENLNQTLKEPWVNPKIIWRII